MATSEKELLPWQQDVLREKADLEVKIRALTSFSQSPYAAGLDVRLRQLLFKQNAAMHKYLVILERRIGSFF
jgi:hypothetical protein